MLGNVLRAGMSIAAEIAVIVAAAIAAVAAYVYVTITGRTPWEDQL